MKVWRDAAQLLLPDLTDCPWDLAENRLLLAARDFYTRSLAWRHTLEPIPVIADVAEYEAVDFNGAEVVRIFGAWLDSRELTPMTADERLADSADRGTSGAPRFIAYADQQLFLSPTPLDSGALLRADVALQPSFKSKGLDDPLWAQHITAIVDGAKALLCSAQGKPYSDPAAAATARAAFESAISTWYWRTAKAGVRGRMPVRTRVY